MALLRPRLLLVGDDITLLYSREMMFGSQFAVDVSARFSEASKLLQDHRFELIVIFQATENWRRLAGFAAQQIPSPRVLVVTMAEDESHEWSDEAICHSKGPYELMKTCSEMFGMFARTKSHGYSNKSFKGCADVVTSHENSCCDQQSDAWRVRATVSNLPMCAKHTANAGLRSR